MFARPAILSGLILTKSKRSLPNPTGLPVETSCHPALPVYFSPPGANTVAMILAPDSARRDQISERGRANQLSNEQFAEGGVPLWRGKTKCQEPLMPRLVGNDANAF
jgi:hypothetical protein